VSPRIIAARAPQLPGVAASQINVVVAYEDLRPEFERVIGLLDAELGDLQ